MRRRRPIWYGRLWLGRALNRCFGLNLELCCMCGRYTTWDDHRLWGPYMHCPACDARAHRDLAAYEAAHA